MGDGSLSLHRYVFVQEVASSVDIRAQFGYFPLELFVLFDDIALKVVVDVPLNNVHKLHVHISLQIDKFVFDLEQSRVHRVLLHVY